ncbi:helix-turn-helix transcriptional regulator [Flavobacterium sp. LHD-80]|uniref:helix-turn-helix domain-containing protein n=1 Tax=Flavobacterium sp. LHD-80 TaxID=3071411 RepID=UPI0027DECE81|nr:helix-turn-helix transcriptional regulator [Flavobacterium sp. LHD-80]MDQ6470067.1 helix-turn-helix transcriptional regulator [Flavobacterium sp. LHD-80]
MSEEFLIKLGDNINARAKAKFKTNLEFASACEIDEASIRRILKGKQNFSIKIFLKICTALDVKMSELLSEVSL